MLELDQRKGTTLVVIDRVTYKKVKADIKSETHAKLVEYGAFYQKVRGSKATESELVEAALQLLFTEDKNFVSFMANGSGSRRPARVGNEGEKGGASDQT